MRASFIDFDDSFTFNVVQELTILGIEVEVINWKDLEELPDTDLLVLGPGPGHPDDYQRLFPIFEEWIKSGRKFFGVCLGHQIFWRIQGEEVVRSQRPMHGQKIQLDLTPDWQQYLKLKSGVSVQRYNSLAVPAQAAIRNPYFRNLVHEGEIMITRGKGILTYQFHPESVGTSFRQAFFRPLLSESV